MDDQTKKPQCDMHLVALANGLALTLVERRENRQVVNRWDPFCNLYDGVKKMDKYVFDKKNKRFSDYESVVIKSGNTALCISLPNSTRVAGAWLLIQDTLRSKHSLELFAHINSKFREVFLCQNDWKQLAQFEAIMRAGMSLCFDTQSDRVEVAGEMVLALIMTMKAFEFDKTYEVVDLVGDEEWPANTPFRDLPKIKMTVDFELAVKEKLPMMTDESIVLISKYQQAFKEYFDQFSDMRLLALGVNPLLATEGFKDIKALLGKEGKDLIRRAKKLVEDLVNEFTKDMKQSGAAVDTDSSEGEI